MNDFAIVRANLFRKKLRTILMMVAIFVAFLIYGVLGSFQIAFNSAGTNGQANRLITVNKINFTSPLPISYYERVRAVEGVDKLTYANWFGGYYQDPKNFTVVQTVEPASYLDVYANDLVVSEAEKQAFIRTRDGLAVGETLARKWGWKLGDKVPLNSNIYTNASNGTTAWDFTVVAILHPSSDKVDTNYALFNNEYFNETKSFGKDMIGWLIMTTTSPDLNDRVIRAIDSLFANSPYETATDTEQAFNKAFMAQLGNIALMVGLVVGAAFVTILMIVGNTMVMAVRERAREVAVLKTLGFPVPRLFRMVLSESLLLAFLGGIPGLLVAALFLVGAKAAMGGNMGNLAMAPAIVVTGLLLMALLGLVTGLIPAWNAIRVNIVTALGRD
jgi:putative ABC transport system permease protein